MLASFGGMAQAADLPSKKSDPVLAPVSPFSGPLASFAAPLAAQGITFHILALDFAQDNPSLGIQRGRGANSLYIMEGVDADLGKLWGLQGTSLHFENVFFAGVTNLNQAAQIGDSQVGYQPPFTPRVARLSRATIEQKAYGDKLDIEIGATHPGYYYALPNCQSINSCFQDLLYLNAGWTSPVFAVPGANVSYSPTPTLYAQAGAFAAQPGANAHVGYDFPDERYNGVVGMFEFGYKTTYAMTAYPASYSITGFFNTADHADLNAGTALGGIARTSSGTSGLVLQGSQTVWRADGGLDRANKAPVSIVLYGSAGFALDSTSPVQDDVYVGATLQSPFQSRPADRFGLKFNWERIAPNYAGYLTASNGVAGGPGFFSPYKQDKYIFEANAHLELPMGSAFEPVVQYTIHPNSFWNPASPVKARDGVYFGGTLVVPIGVILGLQAAS